MHLSHISFYLERIQQGANDDNGVQSKVVVFGEGRGTPYGSDGYIVRSIKSPKRKTRRQKTDGHIPVHNFYTKTCPKSAPDRHGISDCCQRVANTVGAVQLQAQEACHLQPWRVYRHTSPKLGCIACRKGGDMSNNLHDYRCGRQAFVYGK